MSRAVLVFSVACGRHHSRPAHDRRTTGPGWSSRLSGGLVGGLKPSHQLAIDLVDRPDANAMREEGIEVGRRLEASIGRSPCEDDPKIDMPGRRLDHCELPPSSQAEIALL